MGQSRTESARPGTSQEVQILEEGQGRQRAVCVAPDLLCWPSTLTTGIGQGAVEGRGHKPGGLTRSHLPSAPGAERWDFPFPLICIFHIFYKQAHIAL